MDLNEYQEKARETAGYPKEMGLPYCALGLKGEAGEVAEKVKKIIRDEGGELSDEKRKAIALELGDVFWYLANMAYEAGYTLEEVGYMNLEKLASRKKRGKLQGSGDNR